MKERLPLMRRVAAGNATQGSAQRRFQPRPAKGSSSGFHGIQDADCADRLVFKPFAESGACSGHLRRRPAHTYSDSRPPTIFSWSVGACIILGLMP